MNSPARIGIIGATGYVGVELVRLLCGHPGFELTVLASRSYTGTPFSDLYPAFSGVVDLACAAPDPERIADACDLVVTALPHGVSAETVPVLLDRGARVLDHSGDFRYRDVRAYESSYKLTHPRPDLLSEAVYGLPELYRDRIASARLVANPGCYPTCSILALAPALRAGAVRPEGLVIDAVSGVSGAGRKADVALSFCEADESVRAYGVVGHRHTTEIEQELSLAAGQKVPVTFTPHLAPLKRGMLVTAYADIAEGTTAASLQALYEEQYAEERFVQVLPAGQWPDTRNVTGSNRAQVAVTINPQTGKAIFLCAIDNLGKGASAQAVQALNIMAGHPEHTGIAQPGMPL